MQISRMYEILSTLKKGSKIEMSKEEADYLAAKKLIKLLPKDEFETIEKETTDQYDLRCGISALDSEKRVIEEKIAEINKYFTTFNSKIALKSTNDKKRAERTKLETEYGEKEKDYNEMMKKRNTQKYYPDISGYVFAGAGYIKLTDEGREKLRFVELARERLKDASYNDLEKGLDRVREMILSKCQQLRETYKLLVSRNKFPEHESTARFGLVLNSLGKDMDKNIARAHVVDDPLYGLGFTGYDRMDAVSLMLILHNEEGDIGFLADRLVEMYLVMCGDGSSKTYATWRLAAASLKIPGQYALDRYMRKERIKKALQKEVSRSDSEANIIAINLAQEEGDILDIIGKFLLLKNKLIKRGALDNFQLNVAALVLKRMGISFDEGADKFMRVWDVMKASGWNMSTYSYPMVAIVASMPGVIEENLLMISETTKLLEKDFKRSNYMAAYMVASVMNEKVASGKTEDLSGQLNGECEGQNNSNEAKQSATKYLLEYMILGLFQS